MHTCLHDVMFFNPQNTLSRISKKMMNAFWWIFNSSNNKGIKWLCWSRMSMSKKHGGLGFHDPHGFNLPLLGKQCWNLLKNPDALVSRLLKVRYYPHCILLQASRLGGSSFTWSGIWEAKEFMKEGSRWVIGDERSINVYKDRWLLGKSKICVDQNPNNLITWKKQGLWVSHERSEGMGWSQN